MGKIATKTKDIFHHLKRNKTKRWITETA